MKEEEPEAKKPEEDIEDEAIKELRKRSAKEDAVVSAPATYLPTAVQAQ